uniref:Peptidase M11 gametolysin domain-containing protein n=1 Tax=Pseudo-nitzschia australis TaxID=44445 RepID=A0A7S4AQ38_9STRA|mmetsp:Transcript_978/g.2245  ORF Transcript_978/g.2245 Transcript_978/m.2245 type:complete len:628 (-) Transcript_978:9-1892(-)
MNSSLTVLFGALIFQTITTASSSSPLPSSSSPSISTDARLRGSGRQKQTQFIHDVNCILFRKEIRYLSTKFTDPEATMVLTEEKWTCEFEKFGSNDTVPTTVELQGINNTYLETQGAMSGFSALLASKGIVEGSNGKIVMYVPPEAHVRITDRPDDPRQEGQERRNLAASSGTLKTLVVRVIAKNGIEPTASIEQLRSDVFEDQVCLKSQYDACSYGQLKIEPFNGKTTTGIKINGGVVNVKVNVNPGVGMKDNFETESIKEAAKKYGDLAAQFDLVMFSIPPGTGEWLAFAYINRFDSYFNDVWSSSVSTQLHEVGHNLGLAHSGEGSETYGDQSGIMGFSYNVDDAPIMCFNSAKNYQLGWYKEQQDVVNPLTDILGKINYRDYILNGVNDFQFGRNDAKNNLISLRLKQQNSGEDYYAGFNRRSGINSGTVEDANHVTIVKKKSGPIEYGQSWKVSTLSRTEDVYTIKNYDKSSFDVTVKLISIIGKDAKIRISTTNSAPCNEVRDSTNLTFKNKRKRNCEWVSRRKRRRCSKTWKKNELLSEWCPLTCGTCSKRVYHSKTIVEMNDSNDNTSCVDAQYVSFQGDFAKNCDWVGREEDKKEERCAKEWLQVTLSDLCPKTCGTC